MSFSGFPACWNMVIIVIFAVKPAFWATLLMVVLFAAAMFTRLRFVHPVRTEKWRMVTLPVAVAWTLFAAWAAWVDFHPDSWANWGLAVTSLYLCFAGIAQQILYRDDG